MTDTYNSVLIDERIATELANRDEPDLAKCAECGAEMIHVRPGKWQHPDCPQSPRASEPVSAPKHLIERLQKHSEDKSNTAFARSTMREALQYLTAEIHSVHQLKKF